MKRTPLVKGPAWEKAVQGASWRRLHQLVKDLTNTAGQTKLSVMFREGQRRMRSAPSKKCFQFPYVLAFFLAGTWCFCLSADLRGQVVQGHLYDSESRSPVVNGTVALRNDLGTIVARTATDVEGAYELTARTPGTYYLLAVGLGYRSTPTEPFQLVEEEVITIDISLSPQPLELDPLSVEARRQRMVAKLTQNGFYERQRQGFGSFLTAEQIKRWPAINVGDILRHAPFVHVSDKGGISIRKYRSCKPAIYIDGNKLHPLWRVDDQVSPENIVAVEVFRGTTQIPLQWAAYESCGVILIWTDLGGG